MTLAQARTDLTKVENAIKRRETAYKLAVSKNRPTLVTQHKRKLAELKVQRDHLKAQVVVLEKKPSSMQHSRPKSGMQHKRPVGGGKKEDKKEAEKTNTIVKKIKPKLIGTKDWWKRRDPFLTVKPTIANAGKVVAHYQFQLKQKGIPSAAKAYYSLRLAEAQRVHKLVAAVRQTPGAMLAKAADLKRKAAIAKSRKDYTANAKYLEQASALEQEAQTPQEGGPPTEINWSPTAPSQNVAAKLMTQPVPDGSEESPIEPTSVETPATEDEAAITDVEETPWYKKWWVWLLVGGAAAGGAYAIKKGGKAGGIKLIGLGGSGRSFKVKHAPSKHTA